MKTWFRFYSVDGSHLGDIIAYDVQHAINVFLWKLGRGASIKDDIMIAHDNRIVAVMSDRGKRQPDVMVIDYMRQNLRQQPEPARPQLEPAVA